MPSAADYVPYTGPIVTRAEARAAGLKRFFTGEPCKHGHIAERTTSKSMCLTCKNIASKAAYHANLEAARARRALWKKLNRPQVNEWQRASRQRNKERDKAWRVAWHKHNPERQIAASARFYANNAEKLRAKSLVWYYANPEKASAHRANRRARVKLSEGTHTAEDIQRIGTLQKWRCHWCGRSAKRNYHVDHIKPLSKGGTNWPNNLAISCSHCNLSKHDSDPIAFAVRRGFLL